MTFGDVNGDGLPDIVASPSNGNLLVWFRNTVASAGGSVSFASSITIAQSPTVSNLYRLIVADVTSDGAADVCSSGSQLITQIICFTNTGSLSSTYFSATAVVITSQATFLKSLWVGDVRGFRTWVCVS